MFNYLKFNVSDVDLFFDEILVIVMGLRIYFLCLVISFKL